MSPRVKRTDIAETLLALCDAQTRLVEAIESITLSNEHEEADGLMAEAMRRIVTARSANRELQRKRLGLVTIAETG